MTTYDEMVKWTKNTITEEGIDAAKAILHENSNEIATLAALMVERLDPVNAAYLTQLLVVSIASLTIKQTISINLNMN